MKHLVFAFGLILSFTMAGQVDLGNGLVACFPFDGNAADKSGFQNDGTVHGAWLVPDRFGNPNKAYQFDGSSSWIEITNYVNMSPTDAVSISAWIKGNSVNGTRFIYDRVEQNDGYGLAVTTTGSVRLTINGGQQALSSLTPVLDGTWHHVAGTYDRIAGSLHVYVDGVLDGTATFGSQITYIPEPRNGIGGPGASSNFFDGTIDDLKIYTRALNQAEVTELANGATCADALTVEHFSQTTRSMLVYPNPTTGVVRITNAEQGLGNVEVLDVMGQMVYMQTGNGLNTEIDLSDQPDGFYFIRVGEQTEKVILHR